MGVLPVDPTKLEVGDIFGICIAVDGVPRTSSLCKVRAVKVQSAPAGAEA